MKVKGIDWEHNRRCYAALQGLLGDQDNTVLSFQDSVGLPAVQQGHMRQPRVSKRLRMMKDWVSWLIVELFLFGSMNYPADL